MQVLGFKRLNHGFITYYQEPVQVPDEIKCSRYITINLQYSYIKLNTKQPQNSTITRLYATETRISKYAKFQAYVHLMSHRQSTFIFMEHVKAFQ